MVCHAADSLWMDSERLKNVIVLHLGVFSPKYIYPELVNSGDPPDICLRHKEEGKVDQAKNNFKLSRMPLLDIWEVIWPVLFWPFVYDKNISLLLDFCVKIKFSRSYLHIELFALNSFCFVHKEASFFLGHNKFPLEEVSLCKALSSCAATNCCLKQALI